MDFAYFGKLMLSVLVFAPGIIVLAIALVLGVAALLEKAGLFRVAALPSEASESAEAAAAGNPPAGEVVAGLKQNLDAPVVEEKGKELAGRR